MIYHQSHSIIFRDSVSSDAESLALNLRPEDREEIWASHHMEPLEALTKSFKNSSICISIIYQDKVIGMFGINPYSMMSETAILWMLGAPEMEHIKKTFMKFSKPFIKLFLEHYPILENWVDYRYKKAIQWLEWCGVKFDEPAPYGPDGVLFSHFIITR